jgi:hypothetical protein
LIESLVETDEYGRILNHESSLSSDARRKTVCIETETNLPVPTCSSLIMLPYRIDPLVSAPVGRSPSLTCRCGLCTVCTLACGTHHDTVAHTA